MFKARRGVIIGLYVATAIPLLAVVGSGIWLYADLYSTSERFHAEIENGGTSLIPLEPSDFSRLNAPAKKEDAAIPYIKVAKEWEEMEEDERVKILSELRLYSTPREVIHPAYEKSFKECAPFIEKLRAVASKPDSSFDRDWNGDTELLEPHYHTTIQFGRLMTAYALTEARLGNYATAFADINNLRKIALHISRDSGLDGLKTHVNLETQALNAAQEIAFLYGDKSNVLEQYDTFVTNRKTRPDLIRNIEGEAMRTIFVLSQSDSFQDRMFSGTKLSIKNETFQHAAAVRMSEFWVSALEQLRAESSDPIACAEAFKVSAKQFANQRSPSRLIPGEIATWNIQRVNLAAALEGRYALAKTSGNLYAYYHREGKFPDSLSEIQHRETDPFNGDSLAYFKLGNGFKLYSVGSNLLDDGGDNESENPTDIIVVLQDGVIATEGI